MTTETKKENIRDGVKAIWTQLRFFKLQIIILSVLGLISATANGVVPYVIGRFFDTLIALAAGDVVTTGSIPLWLGFLLLWAFIQIIVNFTDWIIQRVSRNVEVDLQTGIQARGFIHLLKLPMAFHKNERISEAINAFDQASWRVKFVFNTIVDFLPQLLSVVVGIILAYTINTFLASILLAGAALYIFILLIMLRPVGKLDADILKEWNEGWGDAASAVYQVDSVKQAAAEVYETEKIESTYYKNIAVKWRKLQQTWNNVYFFQQFLVFATQLAVFVFSVGFVARGDITVGELITLNAYAQMFFGPFFTLGHSWEILQNGLNAAIRADSVFKKSEEVYKPKPSKKLTHMAGKVEFKNVSFSYEQEKTGLREVSFTAEPGEVTALVGESGVGKSTAVSLMSGYYFPTEGAVLIDDTDTRKLNLSWLRSHIAVVPQEVALFNDSIENNIKYGTFDATHKEVCIAAKKAHISDFIEVLPAGYETLVGERGMKLSVGQKQRVAIARAIMRDPAVLILDEPTSALDAKTEQYITASFEELMKNRTTFIIAHRLSTVRKADKILVFDKGQIVETGTHAELIKKKNGIYRKLYEYQIGLH